MEPVSRLLAEARATNERRMLVLTGSPEMTRRQAQTALASTDIDPAATTFVGPETDIPCERVAHHDAGILLGTSREAVIYDCHERCEPNTLGKLVGTVSGGGLFVLLTPPLSEWPTRRDAFDESLAIPPYSLSAVGTAFRGRLVETIRAHRGILIVDAETETVEKEGCYNPASRLVGSKPTAPNDHTFPAAAYDACRTQDQIAAVHQFEVLEDDRQAVVVEADRGRGKSSAAGIAAVCLARAGNDVLVTAPDTDSVGALFSRARELRDQLSGGAGNSVNSEPGDSADTEPEISANTKQRDSEPADGGLEAKNSAATIDVGAGQIRFERPSTAATHSEKPDVVFVDEAAAISVRILEDLLAANSIAFTTTVRGYEGTGRGFAVRFRDRLAESHHLVSEIRLGEPIRYAPADPIEVWVFRALALGASPPPAELIERATPESVSYQHVPTEELLADDQLFREVVGLLVLAHYQTEPNDVARLLDAPNVSVHVGTHDGHVVTVALLAVEGGLSAERRASVYEGERLPGNLIPDILTSQLRDEAAGEGTGIRVLRIATHDAVRSRGLGSQLLTRIREYARREGVDWLGVAYGATPLLVDFWQRNDYHTVHLSTSRNSRSGDHSAIMLSPLTDRGSALLERQTAWFLRRTPASIRESLSDVEPDDIRAACSSAAETPTHDLSPQEWRHVVGIVHGTALYATAPRAVQQLTFRYIVESDTESLLSDTQERVLIRKALQGQSWKTVSEQEGFETASACMRALGEAIEPLVELYGDETAEAERERYQ